MKTLPIQDITLEITNRCNLKCRMCSIWQEKEKKYLDINQIRDLVLSPVFNKPIGSISLTGGEPFMHPDIGKIYKFLVLCKAKKLIRNIGIYSNGYDTSTILDFLKENKKYLSNLSLGISLDGKEKIHNFLRGRNDAFQKTLDTIMKVSSLYSQVNLEIKFTISPYNFDQILDIYKLCRKNNLFFSPKFAESKTKHYYHKAGSSKLKTSLNLNQKRQVKNDLLKIFKAEGKQEKPVVNLKVIAVLIKFLNYGLDFIKTCHTPSFSLFVSSSAKIFPCVYMPALVSLKQKNWFKKFESKKYLEIVNRALSGACPKCLAYHGFLKDFNLD